MLLIKSLCSLLFFTLLLGLIHGYSYDRLDITPQIIKDPQPKEFLNPFSSDYKPINITFDHSNFYAPKYTEDDLKYLNEYYEDDLKHLNESVIPAVQNFMRSTIKVLPRSSKILAKPDICKSSVKVPAYASETGYESDLLIFVKIDQPEHYTDRESVRSAACGLDQTTGRPIVGVLTFIQQTNLKIRPKRPIDVEGLIAMTIHGLVRILGFQEKLFPYYINPETLKPLAGHFFNKTVNDVNTLVLNVAPLTQRVQKHFNCSTAEGAYLENQGDNLTKNSYFERRVFGNELMTAGEMFDRRISQFTLALLEGTGWYKVDYKFADPFAYGKDQGCAFLDTKCMDPVTLKPNFKEFCSPLTSRGTSWTKRGSGFCGLTRPEDIVDTADENLIAAFDYWGNKTVVDDKYSDNCPYFYVPDKNYDLSTKLDLDCENDPQSLKLYSVQTRGPGSKAFMGALGTLGSREPNDYEGYCLKPKCISQANGTYELELALDPEGVLFCPSERRIDASSFASSTGYTGVLKCPDPIKFCEEILADEYCKGDCFGNGVCSAEKKCKCFDGWGEGACVVKQEVSNSSRCTRDGFRKTAFENECICSEKNITCQCALGLKTGAICKPKEENNDNGDKNSADINKNSQNNNTNSSEETLQPSSGGNNRAIFLFVGLVLAVIVVVFVRRRKQADELGVSLVQGSRSHDISAF